MRAAVRDPAELCRLLGLPAALANRTGGLRFPLRVPRPFVARMEPGNPADPLLLQVWPDIAEDTPPPAGYSADPVGDLSATRAPGLLHKYAGRALLVTTGSCAVHCRYCFRREFPYSESTNLRRGWEQALDVLAGDPSLHEVILSGGDPLMLADKKLRTLLIRLEKIPHVARMRLHTRLPIVIPSRVTRSLTEMLASTRLHTVVVLHSNHANELDTPVADAIDRLRQTGALLYNQSVLLRRVNDSADTLEALSNRLLACGVTPYYLHTLDRVVGAAHFEAPKGAGEQLIAELRRRLPGYAVPRLASEEPGQLHKTILA